MLKKYQHPRILNKAHAGVKSLTNSPKRAIVTYSRHLFYNLFSKKSTLKNDIERIYHYHSRKTGGTSLNYSFMRSVAGKDYKKIYKGIVDSVDGSFMYKRRVFAGWNHNLAHSMDYFYAWSHQPYNKIKLNGNTFTVTIIRDPLKRTISLYKHLIHHRNLVIKSPTFKAQLNWLGKNFDDFIEKTPRKNLERQLFMFSEKFDVDEAFKRITGLSHYFFTEKYQEGITELNKKLGLNLEAKHERKTPVEVKITKKQKTKLKKKLKSEYELYNRLWKFKEKQNE